MKKAAITGHCSGIGKGIIDELSKKYVCTGFDLTTGYNIVTDIDKILNESMDCEVFVNNAYSGGGQVELLKKWHELHFYNPYIIINISSIGANFIFDEQEKLYANVFDKIRDIKYNMYIRNKFRLNIVSQTINNSNSKCKSIIIMPTSVATNFSKTNGYEDNSKIKLTIKSVVEAVNLVLKYKTADRFISTLALETIICN